MENERNLNRFIDTIVDLQLTSNLDIITIPYINRPFNILKEIYQRKIDQITKFGKEPFFVIDLKYDPSNFREMLYFLIREHHLRIIGLIYKKFVSAFINYRELADYYNHDTLFFTIQIACSDQNFNNISVSHYMPFLINDISSVAAPTGVFNRETNSDANANFRIELPFNEKLLKLKLFNPRDLLLEPFGHHVDAERILSEMGDPNDPNLEGLLKNYSTEGSSQRESNKRYEILNAFTRVHELKSSTKEFQNFSNFINQNEIKDYVKDHSVLDRTVSLLEYPTENE